ncbi:hypothetical protein GE21DRAFT_1280750 [Neurospora crassa]|nr:hypothetical protein GE21DRAFT_1280750 [Neurospora crassa]
MFDKADGQRQRGNQSLWAGSALLVMMMMGSSRVLMCRDSPDQLALGLRMMGNERGTV